MKVALLHNPDAGLEGLTTAFLKKLLRRYGYQPILITRKQLAAEKRGAIPGEFLVIAGGDGSVKEAACAMAQSGRTIAILPTGTANNIAKSLGIIGSLEKIVRGWATALPVPIDLGVAEGPWGRRYFIESVGIGLVAHTIAVLSKIGRVRLRPFNTRDERFYYDLSTLLTVLHDFSPVSLRYQLNHRHSWRGQFLLWEILNLRYSGPGLELGSPASPSDGWLNLAAVKTTERPELKKLLEQCLAGKTVAPKLPTHRIKHAKFSLGAHELRIDGDIVWPPQKITTDARKNRRITVSVEIAAGALSCMLPQSAP